MVLFRALVASTAAAAVKGLSVGAPDGPAANLLENLAVSKAGTTTALDPELTNTAGEKFHITQEGEWLMVGMPEDASLDEPAKAQVLVTANFSKMSTDPCEDLLIRSITVQGYVLGSNTTKIKLSVNNEVFNSTAALGLSVTQVGADGTEKEMSDLTPATFMGLMPGCVLSRPHGTWHRPTKSSFRRRTKFYTLECTGAALTGTNLQPAFVSNQLVVWWSTVFRNSGHSEYETSYVNDISFSVSDVGKKPVGLLGTDDHTDATKAVPGCLKKQPVMGPYQTRQKGPKEKPWQRRQHEKAAAAKMAAQQE